MEIEDFFNEIIEFLIPYGELGLFLLSFFNSSISPLPSEAVLIPLTLLEPENALWLAFIATLGSSLGAVFGYYIGLYGGKPVINRISDKDYEKIDKYIEEHGLFIVGVSGVSPFPFKLFCIGAGIFNLGAKKLFIVSFIFRGFRYFSIALIIAWLGDEGAKMVQEHMFVSFLLISLTLLVSYIVTIKAKDYFKIKNL